MGKKRDSKSWEKRKARQEEAEAKKFECNDPNCEVDHSVHGHGEIPEPREWVKNFFFFIRAGGFMFTLACLWMAYTQYRELTSLEEKRVELCSNRHDAPLNTMPDANENPIEFLGAFASNIVIHEQDIGRLCPHLPDMIRLNELLAMGSVLFGAFNFLLAWYCCRFDKMWGFATWVDSAMGNVEPSLLNHFDHDVGGHEGEHRGHDHHAHQE